MIYSLLILLFLSCSNDTKDIEGVYEGNMTINEENIASKFTIKHESKDAYLITVDSHVTGKKRDVKTNAQYLGTYVESTKTLNVQHSGKTVEFVFSDDFKSFDSVGISYIRTSKL